MTISEQIKVLCVRSNISVAELARRMGTTPQNFNSKMKRESFTISDLEYLAETPFCPSRWRKGLIGGHDGFTAFQG